MHRFKTFPLIMLAAFGLDLLSAEAAGAEKSLLQRIKSILPAEPIAFEDHPKSIQSLATAIVREHLPSEYEDNRKWGLTKEIYSGLSVRRDGFKIRTKRKRKQVNHGTWKQYRIQQIDPHENVVFEIGEVTETKNGNVKFNVDLTSKVETYARMSQWERGIRLASISVDADAKVRLSLSIELAIKLDAGKLPPDIILKPTVTDANIHVQQFQVNRISKVHGKIAEELGRNLRKILEKKIEQKRPKLVAKINQKIEKKQDDLRFSVSDFVAKKWENFLDEPNSPESSEKNEGRQ